MDKVSSQQTTNGLFVRLVKPVPLLQHLPDHKEHYLELEVTGIEGNG